MLDRTYFVGYGDLFGNDQFSWAWDIPSRELLQEGNIIGKYCDGFTVPKTIKMILDCTAKELWFEVEDVGNMAPCPHFKGSFLNLIFAPPGGNQSRSTLTVLFVFNFSLQHMKLEDM